MTKSTKKFETEVQQLLDLVIHSLYSNKDIFLRELVSNASDAIDKIRFESNSNMDLLEGNADWKIKLIADKDAGTLTIKDNGIGMIRSRLKKISAPSPVPAPVPSWKTSRAKTCRTTRS